MKCSWPLQLSCNYRLVMMNEGGGAVVLLSKKGHLTEKQAATVSKHP